MARIFSFLSSPAGIFPSILAVLTLLAFSLVAAICILFIFLIAPNTQSKKRKEEMLEFTKYKYAHRGLHSETVAENSLTAFRLAMERGYGIELDVRLTQDGVLIVFHDDTLDRATDSSGAVEERTYAELSSVRLLGTKEKIPTLKEVLELVDGRVPLLIELKEESGFYSVTDKTVEALIGYKGKYIIESFNPLAIAKLKKLAPSIPRGILSMNFLRERRFRRPTYFVLQNLLLNVIARPDFIAYEHRQYKNTAFSLCRAIFSPVTFAWTLRSESDEAAASEHGFNGIIFEGYCAKTDCRNQNTDRKIF